MTFKGINTLSLFSGGGGLDLGFASAGYNIFLSSDIDSYSCETLRYNQDKIDFFKNHNVICGDVHNLSFAKIMECAEGKPIEFIIGGPPCQSFSVSGKRLGLDDPRGNLVFEYAKIIKKIRPVGFLLENVAGLKTINDGKTFEELLDKLSFEGEYAVSAHEYDVADYGIPQFRKRLFFIGHLKGKVVPPMHTTHTSPDAVYNGHKPYKTVGLALSNMPNPIIDWKLETNLDSHVGREHSQRIKDRYASLKFGERDHKTRINKLDPQRPSYTIIVGSDKGGGKGHVHPFSPREVTPRESARLQTFPDWWEFYGKGRHVIRQVGNAVPPLFAAQLAAHILDFIFGIKNETNFDYFVNKLKLDFLKD